MSKILPLKAGKLPGRWGWKEHKQPEPTRTCFALVLACIFTLGGFTWARCQEGTPERRPTSPGRSWSPSISFPLPSFKFHSGEPSKEPEPETPPKTRLPPSDRVIVPDVRGRTRDGAAAVLSGARLRVGRVAKRINNRRPGTVLQQSPEPGTRVSPHTLVNLWIVEAPPVAKIRVPNLAGESRSQATNTLARVKLRVGRVGQRANRDTPGSVVDQDPEPGTMVMPGTAVHFWVAVPPVERVRVPDLRGQTRSQAHGTLARVKLRMGRVARKTSDEDPGTVVEQQPKPGTLVHPDFAVRVWLAAAAPPPPPPPVHKPVSAPPPASPPPAPSPPSLAGTEGQTGPRAQKPVTPHLTQVRVPNLVGKKRHLGRKLLVEAGLQEGKVVTRKADLEADIIMAQTPDPGTMVMPGTAVVLVIAYQEPPGTGRPWGFILVGLAILAGGYYVARSIMAKISLPIVQVKPKMDRGIQQLALDTPLHLDLEVRLKPVLDHGRQDLTVTGPLVLEEGEKS
jgi:beta-lactam-binding protein with PASTA domain